MSDNTSIQWADSTVNPIMGCGGCELFPPPAHIFLNIDRAVAETGHKIVSRKIYEDLVQTHYEEIEAPLAGHKNAVNTTNIWHLRDVFLSRVVRETEANKEAVLAAEAAIKQSITCYAAKLHLNKGQNLEKPDYNGHTGYAPIFESVTEFLGRCDKTAKLKDLLGVTEKRSVWKANLPRLIFVSDMGDAMSGLKQFPFLKRDLIPAITSDEGKRHIWMWLTKRPLRLADFADEIGGLPDNVCAMTTLTGSDHQNLKRLADLKKVKAHIRGLSIEPLWERISPKHLDLTGIDWVIVGAESGSGNLTRPFDLAWAEELRDHCRKKRVAFFLKQLGRKPLSIGETLTLRDSHGGDWDEWPDESLKVREFPKAFHNYRNDDMKHPKKSGANKAKKIETPLPPPTAKEKAEFKRLDKIVKKGVKGYMEAGAALIEIREKNLWRVGSYKSWEDYCLNVAAMSRVHAHRLMKASSCVEEMQQISNLRVIPQVESQVRPLFRLGNIEDRIAAWDAAIYWANETKSKSLPTAEDVKEMVDALIIEEGEEEISGGKKKSPSRVQLRAEAFDRLQDAIKQRSWEQTEEMVANLKKLI